MLFVLSTLLGCKRKKEIQNNLSQLNVIEDMNKYFEYNEWGNIFDENSRPFFNNQEINFSDDSAFHGAGCKCDYDIGFKVQYLRFIYSFCCRDHDNIDNKLNLMSPSDIEDSFSNSYYYYFYLYLYLNKLKYNEVDSIKFSNICEEFLKAEKSMMNNFSGYFDYIQFLNLYNKSNKPFKEESESAYNNQNINIDIEYPNNVINDKKFEEIQDVNINLMILESSENDKQQNLNDLINKENKNHNSKNFKKMNRFLKGSVGK